MITNFETQKMQGFPYFSGSQSPFTWNSFFPPSFFLSPFCWAKDYYSDVQQHSIHQRVCSQQTLYQNRDSRLLREKYGFFICLTWSETISFPLEIMEFFFQLEPSAETLILNQPLCMENFGTQDQCLEHYSPFDLL